jgi:hypothetical protein
LRIAIGPARPAGRETDAPDGLPPRSSAHKRPAQQQSQERIDIEMGAFADMDEDVKNLKTIENNFGARWHRPINYLPSAKRRILI